MFAPSIGSVAGAVLMAAFLLGRLRRKEPPKSPTKVVEKPAAKPPPKPSASPTKRADADRTPKAAPSPTAGTKSQVPRVAPRPLVKKVAASPAEPAGPDMTEVWSDLSVLVESEPETEPEDPPVRMESESGSKTTLQLELEALDEELSSPPEKPKRDPVQALLERLASAEPGPPPKTVAKVRVKPRTPA